MTSLHGRFRTLSINRPVAVVPTLRRVKARPASARGRIMNARILAAVTLLLWLPVSAAAQTQPDARLQDAIARSLQSYARLTIFDEVNAHVENAVLTLSGKVTMPFKKAE